MRNKKSKELSRIIVLGEINEDNVNDAIQLIYEINKEDEGKQSAEPIHIILNSAGGDIYDGMALVDVMLRSETQIHVTVHGKAMSMALLIAVCGSVRTASSNTTFMYHEASYDASGKTTFHKQELKEVERLDKVFDNILIERTNLTNKELEKIKKEHKDWYFTAEEAMKLGIIDEVI